MSPRVCAEHVEASPQTSGEAIRSIYIRVCKEDMASAAPTSVASTVRDLLFCPSLTWGGDFVTMRLAVVAGSSAAARRRAFRFSAAL
jgi:hypothetical protein